MSDPTTVLVDVSDLEVRGDDVDLNMEEFLMTQNSGPTTLKPDDPDNALRQAVAETWESKAFADVEIVCGVDGGTLLSHRIVLASLSPFLRTVLESDPVNCQHETSCLMLPDVDSSVLSNFLSKVCLGVKELAFTNPTLEYLDFHIRSCVKTEMNEIMNDEEDFQEEDEKFHLFEFGFDEDIETKGRKQSTGGRRKSLAWKFFEKIDLTTAKCRACENLVKTGNGNTTGMGRHVRRFHPDLYQAFNMSFKLGNKPIEMNGARKKSKRRSVVWNYFIKQDNSCAVCNICHIVIKTEASNTSGMARHLKRAHTDVHFESIAESGIEDVDNQSDSFDWPVRDPTSLEIQMEDSEPVTDPFDLDLPKGKMKSKVWNYFERQDKKLAACLNCDAVIKTEAGNTSGMSRHLKRFHPGIWNTFDDEGNFATVIVNPEDMYEEDTMKGRLRSLVWNYFDREDKTTAVCKICRSTVKTGGGNTSGLARHLRRAHPDEYGEYKEASKVASESETKAKKENQKPVTSISTTKRTEQFRDVWKFYDNVSAGYEENQIGSDAYTAVCKFCEIVVRFTSEDMQPLEDHLSSEHQAAMDELESAELITNDINDDDIAAEESNVKQLRSAIWKYFKRTNVKTKNECSQCGTIMLCARQNTTSMIRHLERRHPELFVTFLQESGSQEGAIKKNLDKKKKLSKDEPNDPDDRTCPECHKVYWHKRAMLYHKKIVHSGERPYKCQDCNLTFARLECFQKHTHNNEERKFLCSLCGKTFGRKSARDLHERAHRGDRRYACGFCTKMFMTNQALTKHERTHTGEKPFQCKDCGKQFATKCHLTTHIRIHTGEKPYFCDFCDLKFRHLSSRSKHKCDGKLMAVKWIHPQNQVLLNEENSIIDSE